MCSMEWKPEAWGRPFSSVAPTLPTEVRQREVKPGDLERSAVIAFGEPGRDLVVQVPASQRSEARPLPVDVASTQVQVDGNNVALHVFALDYAFTDGDEAAAPQYEVVYK